MTSLPPRALRPVVRTLALAVLVAVAAWSVAGARQADRFEERVPTADPAETLPSEEPPAELDARAAPPAEGPDGCGLEPAGPVWERGGEGPYAVETVGFAVQFQDEVSPYRLMSVFAMPGERVEIEPVLGGPDSAFEVCDVRGGEIEKELDETWIWSAPREPGLYSLKLRDRTADETMVLQLFVLRPYEGAAEVNGYRIGRYEKVPLRGLKAYREPRGLIELTPELLDVWVSPHFQLGQFVCKQESDYPKYMLLRTRLLLKLERLLERFNDRGLVAPTFAVLSGYRTPHYNRSIGNRTTYTRHAYGDAADVFIDNDGDGWMDDLDGDGQVTLADARLLFSIVEGLVPEPWYRPFVGGMGLYGPKPHRGPFIHVDTRGYRARW